MDLAPEKASGRKKSKKFSVGLQKKVDVARTSDYTINCTMYKIPLAPEFLRVRVG